LRLATGTGKTLASAAVIKLFLRTGNANRILFLVDRIELENQAWKNLVRCLKNDYTCVIYKENRDDWRKAEIVVSTVQSLLVNNKYRSLFSPTDFDLIISDEAHRSISGNSRAVFEYFVGYKLGLTATPKDYLKKIDPDKISKRDPREWERRQLLDSYTTFGCASGIPTFRYSLIDGVKERFLVSPVVVDARTEITTQLLSDLGYSVLVENDEGELEEKIFYQKDFEKKFFSEKTNRILCKTFLENATRDPLSNEIGKSIIFCVSQNHASKITQILNQYADKMFPEKYNSDFAVQVTSMISDAQQFSVSFANNNLNGHTKVLEGYISSKTRVCVTVGMMTTGYDCEDILNLCLMRPIFSPTDFIQIKGRGTRKYTFRHKIKEGGHTKEYNEEKRTFKLFDFFATCEYFEEKFNYDEVLELPLTGTGTEGGNGSGINIDEYESIQPDPLASYIESRVGPHGMKIDRKFYDQFEETVKNDDTVRQHYERGNTKAAEEYIRENLFDKPEEFFNLEKLRKSVHLDRRLKLWEIIEKAFGVIDRFKSKDELLDEELDKFVSIHKPDASHISQIRNFFKAYVTDNEIRDIMENKEYNRLATNPKVTIADLKALGEWRDVIPDYVKDYVPLNTFM
jgi:type I restriction enzyme R subunit